MTARIYDPACGFGGKFVQPEKFVESHGGKLSDISIYDQECNATTRLIAADKATTMGHIQRGHLTAAKVLIPPRPLLNAMTRTMSPLIDQLIANKQQSRTLATLRDTLLPKLLGGEITTSIPKPTKTL